jgi:hypothetical protein
MSADTALGQGSRRTRPARAAACDVLADHDVGHRVSVPPDQASARSSDAEYHPNRAPPRNRPRTASPGQRLTETLRDGGAYCCSGQGRTRSSLTFCRYAWPTVVASQGVPHPVPLVRGQRESRPAARTERRRRSTTADSAASRLSGHHASGVAVCHGADLGSAIWRAIQDHSASAAGEMDSARAVANSAATICLLRHRVHSALVITRQRAGARSVRHHGGQTGLLFA